MIAHARTIMRGGKWVVITADIVTSFCRRRSFTSTNDYTTIVYQRNGPRLVLILKLNTIQGMLSLSLTLKTNWSRSTLLKWKKIFHLPWKHNATMVNAILLFVPLYIISFSPGEHDTMSCVPHNVCMVSITNMISNCLLY